MPTSRILFLVYPLVMDAFTLLDNEGPNRGEMRARASSPAVEITRGCRLALEWDEMLARYVI